MIAMIKEQILPHYLDEAEIKNTEVCEIGSGHINHTWLIKSSKINFILQKVNTHVFPEPQRLINNIQVIHQHLISKIKDKNYRLSSIGCQSTLTGEYAVEHNDGSFWRALEFIDHSYSSDVVSSPKQAFDAAKAFGHFAVNTSSISDVELSEVIPNFHHLAMRFELLKSAVNENKIAPSKACLSLVDDILSHQWLADEIELIKPQLPLRVCHNDTKINNLLFDTKSNQVKAIIDLDTCMSGHLMYDFGDMIRTFCSPLEEDSVEYEKAIARADIFEAVVKGYFSELEYLLTPIERKSLWLGALAMPLQLAARFLTDHLNGDVYFKVSRPEHNLHRALNQWHLFQSVLKQKQTFEPLIIN